jgi:hypothetical protein
MERDWDAIRGYCEDIEEKAKQVSALAEAEDVGIVDALDDLFDTIDLALLEAIPEEGAVDEEE